MIYLLTRTANNHDAIASISRRFQVHCWFYYAFQGERTSGRKILSSLLGLTLIALLYSSRSALLHTVDVASRNTNTTSISYALNDSARDFGVMRSYDGACSEHCNAVISKTTKPAACCSTSFVSGIINFCSRPLHITCGLFCHTVHRLEVHTRCFCMQ